MEAPNSFTDRPPVANRSNGRSTPPPPDISAPKVPVTPKPSPVGTTHRIGKTRYLVTFWGMTFIANLYSWAMTSQGYVASGITPLDTTFLSGGEMAHLITAVLQVAIFVWYLLMPRTTRRSAIPFFAATMLVMICITISAVMSLISVSLNANGESYVEDVADQVAAIHDGLTVADNALIAEYEAKKATLETLIARSKAGEDGSGVRECGPICKERIRERDAFERQFTALSAPIPAPIDSEDLNVLWRNVQVRQDAFKRKLNVLPKSSDAAFGQAAHADLDRIEQRIQIVGRNFNSVGQTTEITLVMDQVLEEVKGLFQGRIDLSLYLRLLVALLPDILSVLFALLTAVVYRIDAHSTSELEQEIERRERELSLWERLTGVTERLTASKWRFNIWDRTASGERS